ncbi:O-antigen ligase family protein [Vibrio metschnikovii]|nr:O-antigen ligase family protein [Vibrio metschnikovii]
MNTYVINFGIKDFVGTFVRFNTAIYILAFVVYVLTLLKYGSSYVMYESEILGTLLVDKGIPRFVAYSLDPNICAIFIATPLFMHMLSNKGKLDILVMFYVFLILITWSRSAIAVLLLSFLLYLTVLSIIALIKCKVNFRLLFFSTFIITIVFSLIFFAIEYFSVQDLIQKRLDSAQRASGRFEVWSNALELFNHYPFFGIGLYSFLKWNAALFGGAHHIHNTYLDILVESGIFGLIHFLLVIVVYYIKIFYASRLVVGNYAIVSAVWLTFNLGLISSLTAISHEGFIFSLIAISYLMPRLSSFGK